MRSERGGLLAALGRLWISFWRSRALVPKKSEHDARDRNAAMARGRFWTEFREGQREAEAYSSRRR
jgi:hypothetical protein